MQILLKEGKAHNLLEQLLEVVFIIETGRFSISRRQKHSSMEDSKVLVFMEFKHSMLLTFFDLKRTLIV